MLSSLQRVGIWKTVPNLWKIYYEVWFVKKIHLHLASSGSTDPNICTIFLIICSYGYFRKEVNCWIVKLTVKIEVKYLQIVPNLCILASIICIRYTLLQIYKDFIDLLLMMLVIENRWSDPFLNYNMALKF